MHPLDGIHAKIQRAEENINNFDAEVRAYIGTPGRYQLGRYFERNGLEYVFSVRGDPAPPLRFSVLAGEIIHHLRSALDHLITPLVIKNGQTPNGNEQFPVCSTAKAWSNALKDGRINGISQPAKNIIQRHQPYNNATPENTLLYAISDMDNADKHKLLAICVTAAQLGDKVTIGRNEEIARRLGINAQVPAITGFGDPVGRVITEEGVDVWRIILAEPDPAFQADAQITFAIAFEKCGGTGLVEVRNVLTEMLAATKTIVADLEPEFL